jgi:hypothetical protein
MESSNLITLGTRTSGSIGKLIFPDFPILLRVYDSSKVIFYTILPICHHPAFEPHLIVREEVIYLEYSRFICGTSFGILIPCGSKLRNLTLTK